MSDDQHQIALMQRKEIYAQYKEMPKPNASTIAKKFNVSVVYAASVVKHFQLLDDISAVIKVMVREAVGITIQPQEWTSIERLTNLCRVDGIDPTEE